MDRSRIDRAKQVDLSQYLENVHGLQKSKKKSPSGFFYHSPFRTENEASLHVSYCPGSGIWKWFDHGDVHLKGGDSITFIQKLKGCSFLDAVKELLDYMGENHAMHVKPKLTKRSKSSANVQKLKRILEVREFYNNLPASPELKTSKYFETLGLKYHPEIGCKLMWDFGLKMKVIVFPLPNVDKVRGIEKRGVYSLDQELTLIGSDKVRQNNGTKTLWLLRRDTSRLLITESIIDSLAGEIILDDPNISLAALNGVGQVGQLEDLLETVKPKKVYLATDKDKPGKASREIAEAILKSRQIAYEIPIFEAKDYFRELHSDKRKGVKQCQKRAYKLTR